MDGEAPDLRQRVREIPEVRQQIDYRVAYLHKDALPMPRRYDWTWIVPEKRVFFFSK